MKVKSAVIILLLLLAGCSSSSPTDSDVMAVVRQQITNVAMSLTSPSVKAREAHSIETNMSAVEIVIGEINKQSDGSYTAIYTLHSPKTLPNYLVAWGLKEVSTIRMIKSADGWVVVDGKFTTF